MSRSWLPFHRAHENAKVRGGAQRSGVAQPEPVTVSQAVSSDSALPGWEPPVEVILPPGLSLEALLRFKAFHDWQNCLRESLREQKKSDHPFHHKDKQFRLQEITVDSFNTKDPYGMPSKGSLLFVKLIALVVNDLGETLPGVVFLRGGSVTMLMIIRPHDDPNERYVVMTEQARIAAGSLRFQELPAGMLDDENNFVGAAAKEIQEEVNIKIEYDDLIDMTKLALRGRERHQLDEPLQNAMYPSPGACDEFIAIFLWEQEWDRMDIDALKDRLTGVKAEQEQIRVHLEEYDNLLQIGARDAKTLAAWSLYESLQKTNLLNEARRLTH